MLIEPALHLIENVLGSPAAWSDFVAAFRQGLQETGFVEGQNVAIEYCFAVDHYDRLTALAADLVEHHVPEFRRVETALWYWWQFLVLAAENQMSESHRNLANAAGRSRTICSFGRLPDTCAR